MKEVEKPRSITLDFTGREAEKLYAEDLEMSARASSAARKEAFLYLRGHKACILESPNVGATARDKFRRGYARDLDNFQLAQVLTNLVHICGEPEFTGI